MCLQWLINSQRGQEELGCRISLRGQSFSSLCNGGAGVTLRRSEIRRDSSRNTSPRRLPASAPGPLWCGSRPARSRLSRTWRRSRHLGPCATRSEEHTSELQSLMRISYAVFCLKKKNKRTKRKQTDKRTK